MATKSKVDSALSSNYRLVVVLADGETWTEIEGCKVLLVGKSELERVGSAKDFTPVTSWTLRKRKLLNLPQLEFNESEATDGN